MVKMAEKESLEKLLVIQQDLVAEEECIKKMIEKLNAQAHALQVEQLHILNAINSKVQEQDDGTMDNANEIYLKTEVVDPASQKLDLSVPRYQSSEEDEDEIED